DAALPTWPRPRLAGSPLNNLRCVAAGIIANCPSSGQKGVLRRNRAPFRHIITPRKVVAMQEVMRQGLYDPQNEHDACGVGFVVNIKNRKSHDIIAQGLKILENLDHRRAVGADPLVGDGAGILIQMPDALLNDWARTHGKSLPAVGRYAVAMCFLPRDASAREHAIQHFEQVVAKEGQAMVGWRDVPTDLPGVGKTVIETMPVIRQAIIASNMSIRDQHAVERKILAIRKQILNNLRQLAEKRNIPGVTETYMPSFSTRTVTTACTAPS